MIAKIVCNGGNFLESSVMSRLFMFLCPFIILSRAAISRDPFYEMLAARKKKASSLKRQ